jgi:copper chaperone CopZ
MSPGRPNPSDGAPPVPETTPGGEAPCNLPRRRLFVHLDGLVAVHAARAVHTALAGVPGVRTAAVTLAGAELEVEGTLDREALAAAVALAGATVREVVAQPRTLPLFEGDGA